MLWCMDVGALRMCLIREAWSRLLLPLSSFPGPCFLIRDVSEGELSSQDCDSSFIVMLSWEAFGNSVGQASYAGSFVFVDFEATQRMNSQMHRCKRGLHWRKTGLHWCKRPLGDHCSNWPKCCTLS